MSIFNSVFDWFKGESETNTPTKQQPRRPSQRDWTDSLQVNGVLTRQLYHNSYPGMKLAGSMAFNPIAVPVWFMGLPIPKSESDSIQEIIDDILETKSREMVQIHLQCHREGTIWIYPFFSSKQNKVVWEFIPDDVVTDIIRDIDSGDVVEIITDEEILLTISYGRNITVRRRRTFSKTKVTTQWFSGRSELPNQLIDKAQRNVAGILPIPFANNRDGDEVRGHSDYERIVTDLKDYHDIDLKRSEMLAKFDAKMVQYVKDVENWKKNNGWNNLTDINIGTTDLIINLFEQEKTEFAFPERAHEAYDSALKNKFRKIVEGSGIPEIIWGTRVTGNHATSEEQMDTLVKFVEDKRSQKNKSYLDLFSATIKLILISTIQPEEIDIQIEWNNLDAVSEKVKSEVFLNFSRGVNQLINSAGITKDQLFKTWRYMYPQATEDDFDEFEIGLAKMARHKQFQNEDFALAQDFGDSEENDRE
jgi:hypothetical protein